MLVIGGNRYVFLFSLDFTLVESIIVFISLQTIQVSSVQSMSYSSSENLEKSSSKSKIESSPNSNFVPTSLLFSYFTALQKKNNIFRKFRMVFC